MNIKTLKNIMKEVNAPNNYIGYPSDKDGGDRYPFQHPLYWVFKVSNIRIKTLDSRLETKRRPAARFDVFYYESGNEEEGELFVRPLDYKFEQVNNDFYVKFIRANFPTVYVNGPEVGTPFSLNNNHRIILKGDLENIN